jgi:glycolate oxidase
MVRARFIFSLFASLGKSAAHAVPFLFMLQLLAVDTTRSNQTDPRLIAELRETVGADGIISRATELKVYECDGWTIEKSAPEILLRPRTTAEVSAVLKILHRRNVAFVPRGAGTGLSGGCLPLNAPVMICTSRMNRILAIDLANRQVEVESGVVNLHVTNAVKTHGLFYAPDPSSQVACTIGGNIGRGAVRL